MNFLEKSPSSQPGWKKRRMKQSERLRELPGRQPLRAAASLVMNSQKGPPGGSGDFFISILAVEGTTITRAAMIHERKGATGSRKRLRGRV